MKAITALVVVCAFLPLVIGHGWVTNPQPRGYTGDQGGAAQTSPCGPTTTNDAYPQIVALTVGDYLNVSWTIGGGHTGTAGPDTCRFAWSLTDTNATSFDSNVLVSNIGCAAGNHAQYFAFNANSITQTTTAYLQFKWSAGDGGIWYNCVKMSVSPTGVTVTDKEEGQSFSDSVSPSQTHYFKVDVPTANKHLYVTITANGNATFALSGGNMPTDADNTNTWAESSAGNTFILSGCSLEDTPTSFYLAATGKTADVSFTAEAESYDAMMFPVYKAPQIKDKLNHGGSKFYWTEAYTEGATYKRVYVKKTSGSGSVRLWKSLECIQDNTNTNDESLSDEGSKGACVDLGTTQGRKYIQVESVDGESIEYDLGVEDGVCADKDFDAATSLQVSFMLLIVAVLFTML